MNDRFVGFVASARRTGKTHGSRAPFPFSEWILRCLASLILSLVLACGASAQSTNRITGKVLDSATGKPLAFTNVVIVGTSQGAMTKDDGSFAIENVAPGTYDLQASYLGYETSKHQVIVSEGKAAAIDFRLDPVVAKREKEVVITAERPLVDVTKASTTRSFNSEELKNLTISPTLDSVVEQQPGVTRDNNQIHIRGGRSEETLYIVDGVQMRDVLSGDSEGKNVSARSVAEVNIITGGFDAKYGQALSGIIEAKLKEGSDRYEGYLGYSSDELFNDWNTRLMDFQIGGPLPLFDRFLAPLGGRGQTRPTFFLNLASDMTNGYLPSIRDLNGDYHLQSAYKDRFFGKTFEYGRFFTPEADNDWRILFKSAWKASSTHKFIFSATKSLSFNQGFNDIDVSEVNRNKINYPWAWSNVLQRYTTVTSDQGSLVFGWTHTPKSHLFHTLKATRYFSARHTSVDGKLWDELPESIFVDQDPSETSEYFVDGRSISDFRIRNTRTWAADWDWQYRTPRHKLEWGGRAQYEDVLYLSLDARTITSAAPLGDEFDLFHVYPTTGAFYMQDGMSYEDLTASVGIRYDYWFPGKQVEDLYDRMDRPTINSQTRAEWLDDTHSLFGRRFKGHLSPRISVSHAITDHDNLFFNYGHFTQRPPYFYVYAKSSSQSSEEFPNIGNPNLNPEVSVAYELGAGHKIGSSMSIKSTLFYKDIYDYPTSTTVVLQDRPTSRSNFFIYRNLDYARSRGVELEFRQRRLGHMAWSAAYTYSVVKGKSSDPNKLKVVQGTGGDARETSLDEEFMWWNRPHKVTLWYDYKVPAGDHDARVLGLFGVPADVGLNLFFQLQSGRAYTPTDIFGNQTGTAYSKNGPIESLLNGTLSKGFPIGGKRVEVSLQGWNLFDHRTLQLIDPATGDKYVPGSGSLTGNTTPSTYARYSDPSQWGEPRHFRLGFGMEF